MTTAIAIAVSILLVAACCLLADAVEDGQTASRAMGDPGHGDGVAP